MMSRLKMVGINSNLLMLNNILALRGMSADDLDEVADMEDDDE